VFEGELSGEDDVSGDASSLAVMINGYYEFPNKSAFTPFITEGIGFAQVEYDMSSLFSHAFH
jgi:opacity protein-like surface antigen